MSNAIFIRYTELTILTEMNTKVANVSNEDDIAPFLCSFVFCTRRTKYRELRIGDLNGATILY